MLGVVGIDYHVSPHLPGIPGHDLPLDLVGQRDIRRRREVDGGSFAPGAQDGRNLPGDADALGGAHAALVARLPVAAWRGGVQKVNVDVNQHRRKMRGSGGAVESTCGRLGAYLIRAGGGVAVWRMRYR